MDGLIGIFSNSIAIAVTQPIDTLKINYQTTVSNSCKQPIIDVLKNTLKTGGTRSLYSGLVPNMMSYPIFYGVFFQTKEGLRKHTIRENEQLDKLAKYFIAGGIGSSVSNPLFVIKTRMQTNPNNIPAAKMISTIFKENGLKGFYKGLNATLINNSKLTIQFPLYDIIKDKTDSIVISSGASKLLSNTIFNPFELIRTNQRNSKIKISILDVAKNIYKSKGIRGFYHGTGIYNLASCSNFIVTMVILEKAKKLLIDNRNDEDDEDDDD
jgi:hypothetical protein